MTASQDRQFPDPPRAGCFASVQFWAGVISTLAFLALGLVLLAWLAGDRF